MTDAIWWPGFEEWPLEPPPAVPAIGRAPQTDREGPATESPAAPASTPAAVAEAHRPGPHLDPFRPRFGFATVLTGWLSQSTRNSARFPLPAP
jgi:hypothetical protein